MNTACKRPLTVRHGITSANMYDNGITASNPFPKNNGTKSFDIPITPNIIGQHNIIEKEMNDSVVLSYVLLSAFACKYDILVLIIVKDAVDNANATFTSFSDDSYNPADIFVMSNTPSIVLSTMEYTAVAIVGTKYTKEFLTEISISFLLTRGLLIYFATIGKYEIQIAKGIAVKNITYRGSSSLLSMKAKAQITYKTCETDPSTDSSLYLPIP